MLVGRSPVIQDLRVRVARIAVTPFTVLIEGESGAGKELVARELHDLSPRRRGPFVAVNCAALVESLLEAELFGIEERTATGVRGRRGKFELADQGTLFLDEIGDLSAAAQAKLLRIMQDMTVERVGAAGGVPLDVRVVAATNRRLQALVDGGLFRLDLFYRLSGVEVQVPPLRVRRGDVRLLVEHFLDLHGGDRHLTMSLAALDALSAYHWPGNVRQLRRVLERVIALAPGPVVTLDDLPPDISGRSDPALEAPVADETLRAWSSRYVRVVLERCQGNKRRACDVLGISFHTLRAHLGHKRPAPSDGTTRPAPLRRVAG
ncbi:MAG: sigma-54 dependent transcriptional regulator [Vicinamibacterales bacterium]